jgi:hypothetical protein
MYGEAVFVQFESRYVSGNVGETCLRGHGSFE